MQQQQKEGSQTEFYSRHKITRIATIETKNFVILYHKCQKRYLMQAIFNPGCNIFQSGVMTITSMQQKGFNYY